MKSSCEKLDATQTRVDITVTRDDWQKAANKIYAAFATEVEIPGFRPGRAPRNVIERHIGRSRVFDAIKDEVVNDTVFGAIQEHKLQPIGRPNIDLGPMDELGEIPVVDDVTFNLTIEIWPEVPDFKYKGLKIYVKKRAVTDEDIENSIESLKLRNADRTEVKDRPTEHGDWVTFRLKGTVEPDPDSEGEGEPFKMEDVYTIHLGYDESIPGISPAITGLKIGEGKDFEIIVPKEFKPEELRGRRMQSHVEITRIYELRVPELTGEFINDKFGLENMDELRENIRTSMEQSNRDLQRKETNEALEEYFINTVPIISPQSFVDSRKVRILDDMRAYYKRQNQDLDEIMRDKEEAEKIRQKVDEEAHTQVRLEMIYDEIAQHEKIEVEAEEVRNYLYTMRSINVLKDKDIKKLLKDENFILSIRNDIKNRKVIDLLIDNNEAITVDDPSEVAKRVEEFSEEAPSETTTDEVGEIKDDAEEDDEPGGISEVDENDSIPDNKVE